MLTRTRRTLAVALAASALSTPAAFAQQAADLRTPDARDAGSAQRSDAVPGSDLRSPDAREPNATPVVVDVETHGSPGFDWTAAIIGAGAGLALAVLAGVGVGVAGGRRRPVGSRMG